MTESGKKALYHFLDELNIDSIEQLTEKDKILTLTENIEAEDLRIIIRELINSIIFNCLPSHTNRILGDVIIELDEKYFSEEKFGG